MAEGRRIALADKAREIRGIRNGLITMLEDYPYSEYNGQRWDRDYWTRSYLKQAIEALFRLESDVASAIIDELQADIAEEKETFEKAEENKRVAWEANQPSE